MTQVLRIIAGTVLTLLLVVYFASFQPSTSTVQTNVLDTVTEHTTDATDNVDARCGVVSRVLDGDTIDMQTGDRVRLIGIDAPEMNYDGEPEWYAEESYAKLKLLVEGKEVCLETDSLQADTDQYGRLLRYVYNGTDNINGLLIAEGFARVYTKKPFEERDGFMYFEEAAKAQEVGLWSTEDHNAAAGDDQDIPLSFDDTEIVAVGPDTSSDVVTVDVNPVVTDLPSFDTRVEAVGGDDEVVVKTDFLTLEEARTAKKFLGQRKTVSFKVRSAWDRGSVVYLNSEKNQESLNNFSIMIPAQYKTSFVEKGLDSVAHFYLGETIEATGTIKFYKGVVMLEVTSFADMHIL